jgi:hypothetical protein
MTNRLSQWSAFAAFCLAFTGMMACSPDVTLGNEGQGASTSGDPGSSVGGAKSSSSGSTSTAGNGGASTSGNGGSESPTGGSTTCSLLGAWHTHSSLWNGLSTDAVITFKADGTLTGVPTFSGLWTLEGTKLTISGTVGEDMNCDAPDYWTLTYSQDCGSAPLHPISSGCIGARRYLDWDVTLTRN